MQRITPWLWLALAGAALLFVSLGSDFYLYEGERQDAWNGVPQTSHLILLAALVAVGLFILTATGRNPVRGRNVGLLVGVAGLLATLQLGYRMLAPPFDFELRGTETLSLTGSCLWYCLPAEAANADLLAGIWIAFAGCLAVAAGGFLHAFSPTARQMEARPWIAPEQGGANPWLGLAALGAIGQVVFGYTFFTFYTTIGDDGGEIAWSGWLPTPHTSSLVLALSAVVVGLVVAAARGRSPLSPTAVGGLIAVLGFVSASRVLYRIVQPPFGTGPVEIGFAAYLSAIAGVLVLVAGIVYAVTSRRDAGGSAPRTVE